MRIKIEILDKQIEMVDSYAWLFITILSILELGIITGIGFLVRLLLGF